MLKNATKPQTKQPAPNVQIIKANYALQAKVGSGPLDKKTVELCQKVMDNNNVDFAPIANILLEKLNITIKNIASEKISIQHGTQQMRAIVMELKANAGTFGYALIGNLAHIMLSFLESVKAVDSDVIEIVEAHHKTLSIIISKRMKGTGGQNGQLFEKELKNACQRYFERRKPD